MQNQAEVAEQDSQDTLQIETENHILLHSGIAEQGKLLAISGDHSGALEHYRYAMNLSVEHKHPEVFFRHYLECVIESLEHTGAYEEVLNYCDKAIELYQQTPPPNEMAEFDLANIHFRKGVILFKSGDKDGAGESLQSARKLLPKGYKLPLLDTFLRWLQTNLHVQPKRIVEEQFRHKYFSVTPDNVNPDKAIPLPAHLRQPKGLV